MKRWLFVLAAGLMLAFSLAAAAQAPEFRQKGFKGSVGLSTDSYIGIAAGFKIPLSNGYMFNEHHYLGGGYSLVMPVWGFVIEPDRYVHEIFAEYQCFFLKKNSSPLAGIKIMDRVTDANGLVNIPMAELTAGWSWGLGKYGISVKAGAIFNFGVFLYEYTSLVFPDFHVAFEF